MSMEQDIQSHPLDPKSVAAFQKLLSVFYDELAKIGVTQMNGLALRRCEKQILPRYTKLIKDIKKSLDPDGILAPRQLFKEI